MFGKMGKSVLVGSAIVAGLGLSAGNAAADSFSVSVHTPGVSVGYNNHHGHNSGYVSVYQPAPRPVVTYCPPPAPVVVYRPVVVHEPVHVCRYDSRPVTRYYVNECGRRVYYTQFVRVRLCDDHHHNHLQYVAYDDHRDGRGHGKHHDDKHRRGHDRDHYARDWDNDDRDNDRRGRHGRDGD